MKTTIQRLCLLLTVISFALTSCNKDENSPESPIEPDTPVTASIEYVVPNKSDFLKVADITVYYTKADGTEASEQMTSEKWTKTITGVKVPGTYTIKLEYKRNNKELDQEKYILNYERYIKYKYSDQNDWASTITSTSTLPVSKDKIETYIASILSKPYVTSIDLK